MSKIFAKAGDTIHLEVKSSGPYLISSNFQILNDTIVTILWKQYKTIVESKRPSSNDTMKKWEVIYDEIDLGEYDIKCNSIIDMKNKYYPVSHRPDRALSINENLINNNCGGTSSDIYYITFTKDTEYIEYKDSSVDH